MNALAKIYEPEPVSNSAGGLVPRATVEIIVRQRDEALRVWKNGKSVSW